MNIGLRGFQPTTDDQGTHSKLQRPSESDLREDNMYSVYEKPAIECLISDKEGAPFWDGSILSPAQVAKKLDGKSYDTSTTGQGNKSGTLVLKRNNEGTGATGKWTGPSLVYIPAGSDVENVVTHSTTFEVDYQANSMLGGGTLRDGSEFRVYRDKNALEVWAADPLGQGRVQTDEEKAQMSYDSEDETQ